MELGLKNDIFLCVYLLNYGPKTTKSKNAFKYLNCTHIVQNSLMHLNYNTVLGQFVL